MGVMDLLAFLGLPGDGAAELVTSNGRGYFTDVQALTQTVAQVETAALTVHPFPKDAATNEVGQHVQRVTRPEAFGAVVARFHHPPDDEHQLDTSTMAGRLAQGLGAAVVWVAGDNGYLTAAVEPFPFHDELETNAGEWLSQLRAHTAHDYEDAVWEVVDSIPLTAGQLMVPRPRAPSASVRRILWREIPDRIKRRLDKGAGDSKLAKLYQSRLRRLGVDEKGRPIPVTEENFDRAFVRELCCAREEFRNDEIVDALWNRPNCTVREKGLAAVEQFVSKIREEVDRDRSMRPRAPIRPQPRFTPGESLHSHLHGLYFQTSETTGGWVQRHDVEVSYKAEVVMRYLIERGAEFYYFKGSNETVFVVDGRQVVVNEHNAGYQSWFIQNVQLFTPTDTAGKALTLALRVKIQDHPDTHKPPHALWGRYDKHKQALYFCFDPEHMQMLKVSAAPTGDAQVEQLNNGAEGVTLRGMQMRTRKVDVHPEALKAGGWQMYVDLLHNGQALSDGADDGPNYRLMSTVYNLTTLLPNHRQRPIKLHTGTEGSGKTTAATDVGYVLYGITPGAEYSEAVLLARDLAQGGPYVVQDNVELKDRRKFGQMYLVTSTGNPIKIRQYYTDSQEKVFEPNGSLVLTAIEGFHRPEEMRRTFEFDFDKKWWSNTHEDLGTRAELLESHGDLMLCAILEVFSLRILPDFEARFQRCKQWLQQPRINRLLGNKKPYLGWIARMLAVCEAMGDMLVDNPSEFEPRVEFERWLQATYLSDSLGRLAADPNMDLLEALRNEGALEMTKEGLSRVNLADFGHVGVESKDGTVTIGPVTTGQLHRAFGAVARRNGIRYECGSSRALGSRLKALASAAMFEEAGWSRLELQPERNGSMQYAYVWKSPVVQDSDFGNRQESGDPIDSIYE